MTGGEDREAIGASHLQGSLFEGHTVRYRDLDQWYTKPDVAEAFIKWCRVTPEDRILEPSCGEGGLILAMPNHDNVRAFDIDDSKVEIVRAKCPRVRVEARDYMSWEADEQFDVVIMNSPYRNELDAKFIERATHHAPRVCGLVRSVFLNGDKRSKLCHDHVIYTRVQPLKDRPEFGGDSGPKTDFTFVECRRRLPHEQRGVHLVELITGR